MVFVAHAEGRCPCLNPLQLVLQDVSPAIALDDEHDLPILHLIEIFVAVSPDLAYYDFEGLVGVSAFFTFLPLDLFSSVSFSIVDGSISHSWCISITALHMATTWARVEW